MFELLKDLLNLKKAVEDNQKKLAAIEKNLSDKEKLYEKIKSEAFDESKKDASKIVFEAEEKAKKINDEISKKDNLLSEVKELENKADRIQKKITKEETRFSQLTYINKKLESYIESAQFYDRMKDQMVNVENLNEEEKKIHEELLPTVTLKLHCIDVKELKKKFKDNEKAIKETLEKYEGRYTTKANATIYKLMVIALQAELQNVLYNLKFNKLENSVTDIKKITQKYLAIAGEGNQSIVNTLVKFITSIEYLFIKAIEIEYEYYIKKEMEKEEQARLREQMRQEAEERKLLEQQQKQIEKEEEKYNVEMTKTKEMLENAKDDEKINQLTARLKELEDQLNAVHEKKEEIIKLQNGKAGYVYIISNLGSLGENTFKIGMTRRLNPQDRVDELGDASVPFRFDVHSFIFSDSAVDLETKMHSILEKKRVNKINHRKEFFNVTIDELEALVQELYPSAEFNRTMIAEEYRQSLSIDELESL
jgi:hypothetical protein